MRHKIPFIIFIYWFETTLFADSNWGPQDAPHPKENETRTVEMAESKSIQGCCLTRMGGPLLNCGGSNERPPPKMVFAFQQNDSRGPGVSALCRHQISMVVVDRLLASSSFQHWSSCCCCGFSFFFAAASSSPPPALAPAALLTLASFLRGKGVG